MTLTIVLLIWAIAVVATGCSSNNPNLVRSDKEVQKEDGSTVVVSTSSNGTRTEARTFPSGDVARVTRINPPNGRTRAIVEFRDTRSVEIKDEDEIDHIMDASADTIKTVAMKLWEAMKSWEAANSAGSEAADKTEDAADKAAGVGKEVGKGAKRGAEAVGDAASDTAAAAKAGVKKTGKGIKKVGEKIKDSVTP
ncbi:MAG TPA: hypothetical protein VF747_05230 [Blastocatellia bacterium]